MSSGAFERCVCAGGGGEGGHGNSLSGRTDPYMEGNIALWFPSANANNANPLIIVIIKNPPKFPKHTLVGMYLFH